MTRTPSTGLPAASVARTTSDSGSVVPTGASCASPRTSERSAGTPAAAKAVNRAGSIELPSTRASAVYEPAAVPSAHSALAIPWASVVASWGDRWAPVPETTANTTRACATGRPAPSPTRTVRGSASISPTRALWLFPWMMAMDAGRASAGSRRSLPPQAVRVAARIPHQARRGARCIVRRARVRWEG